MQQINPPFDGGAPCPMCSQEIRGASAYAHNMLNRWREGETLPEPKFWVKLDDLVMCVSGEPGYADPAKQSARLEIVRSSHPDVRAHLEAILAVVTEYRKHERPRDAATAQVVADAIAPLVDALRKTQPAINQLSEAHFDDMRHAGGEINILRSQQGYSPDRGGNYDWFVRLVENGPYDIRHQVCGTKLLIHDHFVERIRRDGAFYGQAWCPTCRINAPWPQFDCRVA